MRQSSLRAFTPPSPKDHRLGEGRLNRDGSLRQSPNEFRGSRGGHLTKDIFLTSIDASLMPAPPRIKNRLVTSLRLASRFSVLTGIE